MIHESWKSRLRIDRWNLIHKIDALDRRLHDPVFILTITDHHHSLLQRQRSAMASYLSVLTDRMTDLGLEAIQPVHLDDDAEIVQTGSFDADRDGDPPFR